MGDLTNIAPALRSILAGAIAEREQRPDLVDTPNGPECAWALYEREQMLGAVNAIRADLHPDWPPVPMELVEHADQQAAGHVDWFRKFAWSCAELVIKERPDA
jgi:hypothetical protein